MAKARLDNAIIVRVEIEPSRQFVVGRIPELHADLTEQTRAALEAALADGRIAMAINRRVFEIVGAEAERTVQDVVERIMCSKRVRDGIAKAIQDGTTSALEAWTNDEE